MISLRRSLPLFAFLLLAALPSSAPAEPLNASLYSGLRWRMIGPFRGGRTVACSGVPGQPNVFYMAANNGGVWKTNDFGRTWNPLFDEQPTGSIGALAVAPSDPNTIYVGSGEGIQRPDLSTGDGIYKSTDAGKTWQHLGLRDGQQIGAIIIHPRDPNKLYVAVLGHPYGPNEERGVFRSTDGGQSWQKVLYKDENTGAIALAFDPSNPDIVYADLFASRQGPWENGQWSGPNSGLFKSTDSGNTWQQLTKGLPTTKQGLGRIGFCVAASDPNRLYANIEVTPPPGSASPQRSTPPQRPERLSGIYRSDDAGETWQPVNTEARLYGRGFDFAEIKADPKNKDLVYICNTSTYRSADGGRTFHAIKGAPGGDDYHTVWISPENSDIILLASDQGATISVNGGQTWSSWYNQPTAQFYHVITDNQFPYWVYGAQQESGSAAVASRGNYGQITFWDWHPVGVEEYGYVAPDPLNPNIIYGSKASRYDRTTGQTQLISPQVLRGPGKYRFLRTAPMLFSPVDPHILYMAGNVLFKTTNGGHSWEAISPDLTREHPEVPESIGIFRTPEMAKMPQRGVIYTVAPSYKKVNVIWAGTDDGLIHVTRDGGRNWANVTPPGITSWSKISLMDAGRFDVDTAYAAVNRIRLDDMKPHIYRTHDSGKTWTEIVNGLPNDAPVNVVREDPLRQGMLFAGTERAVYVSFNDGDDWQPLRLNMPATSIRDLVIHDDDVVLGTHGRSFWILDDITPLRQATTEVAATAGYLFKPQLAYRVRWNMNTDTPLPPEEPAAKNPPDGAIINYYLKSDAQGPLVIEVLDHQGELVRRYASTDKPDAVNEKELDVPTYWIRPSELPSTKAGMQRFVWDLHYPPPQDFPRTYPISAVYRNTASIPEGPWVLPGEYTVKLTVGDQSYTQPLTVKMDPRVKIFADALGQQFALAKMLWQGNREIHAANVQIRNLRTQLQNRLERAGNRPVAESIKALEGKLDAIAGRSGSRRAMMMQLMGAPGAQRPSEKTLARLNGEIISVLETIEGADAAPTTQAAATAHELRRSLDEVSQRWRVLQQQDLLALNGQLREAKLEPVTP